MGGNRRVVAGLVVGWCLICATDSAASGVQTEVPETFHKVPGTKQQQQQSIPIHAVRAGNGRCSFDRECIDGNTCQGGVCKCGNGAACVDGHTCQGGQCKCGVSGPCAGAACWNGECGCGEGPPCINGNTCQDGRCKCGNGAVCTNGHRCEGGKCTCGGGAICSASNVNWCLDGVCTCGFNPPCVGAICYSNVCGCGGSPPCREGNTCQGGVCKCGTGAGCTNHNMCVGGQCKCGSGPPCVATSVRNASDWCDAGVCKCGRNPPCSGETADACRNGECACGGSAACTNGNTCRGGECKCGLNEGCINGHTCAGYVCLCGNDYLNACGGEQAANGTIGINIKSYNSKPYCQDGHCVGNIRTFGPQNGCLLSSTALADKDIACVDDASGAQACATICAEAYPLQCKGFFVYHVTRTSYCVCQLSTSATASPGNNLRCGLSEPYGKGSFYKVWRIVPWE